MTNYVQKIRDSGLTIYDKIGLKNSELFIPTNALKDILSNALINTSLSNFPLKKRSKIVKSIICKALGYPVPLSFIKIHPQFPGQNFDVYTQKSLNVQIWNEKIDFSRRYVFLKVSAGNIITNVRVISGNDLAQYDHTGKLTIKYQAKMNSYSCSKIFSKDSLNVSKWISDKRDLLCSVNPNASPTPNQILPIQEVYNRLLPLVGSKINYLNPLQDRNRGAELHAQICKCLGYSVYEDNGTYPDIVNQLLEIKMQTSPTIDLGLHSPKDGTPIVTIGENTFTSQDIRYVIFDGSVEKQNVHLNRLYLVSGYKFTQYFPLFNGKNSKIQLPLPNDFFNY